MESSSDLKGDSISIKVKDQNGSELVFKIKKSTKMEKVINSYCERMGVTNRDQIRFIYNSLRVKGDATPEKLDMEDGDEINVFAEALGGNR